MDEELIFKTKVEMNHGHDWVNIKSSRGYGDVIEIEFQGRDPTTVTVRLVEIEDAEALGNAIILAAKALQRS